MRDFDVRLTASADLPRIARLFERAFGVRRSPAEWEWRYRRNPHGRPITVAAFDGEKPIAFLGGYPLVLIDTTSAPWRESSVVHVGDAMVDPAYQGKGYGKAGPWQRALAFLLAEARERGHSACFGVPVRRFHRVYRRYVSSWHLLQVECWAAPLSQLRLVDGPCVAARLRRDDVDGTLDRLLQECAPGYGLLARRDAAYTRWRHLERPSGGTRLFAARSGTKLVGWGAFRLQGRRLVWGDALIAPGHPTAASALLRAALRSWRWRRPQTVRGWFPSTCAWLATSLRGLGFEVGPQQDDLGVIVWGCPEDVRVRRRLYYSMSDCDLF